MYKEVVKREQEQNHSHDGLDQSQEQGFFTQKIEIKQSANTHVRSISVNTRSHFNKSPFEAKHLPWTGPMKKEPIQALKVSSCCVSDPGDKSQRKKNKNIVQDHPYRLYATNQNYQLVYCRNKGTPIVNSQYFMSNSLANNVDNQVRLHHVGGKNIQGFKKLKDFELGDNGQAKTGTLSFDSRFECGNLHCVFKNQKQQEYVLFIENDTNSLGYNQWFYFSIQHNQANVKYTFRIVNFKKKHSFFKYGCKPAMFSLHEARARGEGWNRRAKNVHYEQSPIYIQQSPNTKFYCLSFDLTFEHKDDYIMVAMSPPYSYTKMIAFLKEAEILAQQDPINTLEFSIKSVCLTVCGNDVPEVTITRKCEDQDKKKMVIIMARQHPGEIWSSYMVEGMIRKLVSKPDEDMLWLLENYVIKIYPMINVDGVIYGNFRCDITGLDLNRRWKDTSRLMHPQVHQIKRKIGLYRTKYKVESCFDLHGHSKNYNIFCYTCKDNSYSCRLLPMIISKINPVFHFPSCTFGISRYKETTARAAIYKLTKNQNVLTIESSFYGSKLDNVVRQFGPADIFTMGENILLACRMFLDKKSKMHADAKKEIESRISQFLGYDKIHEEDSGSESDPSGDEIDLETKINLIFDKNLVNIDDLTGIKREAPKMSPIKIKLPEQEKLEIKGQEYQKRKAELTKAAVAKKQIPLYKNQAQTIEQGQMSHINFGSAEVGRVGKQSKKTISYSQHKSIDKEAPPVKLSNAAFRERKHKFSGNIGQASSQRKGSVQQTQVKVRQSEPSHQISKRNESMEADQLQKSIERVRKSDEFIKKFQRFIPISMAMKSRANVSMFEQSLYNEDQNNLISMLLQNKKKIELEKIKRNQNGREKLKSQADTRRWSTSSHSNRMRKLICRSGNQLASVIVNTISDYS